MKSLEKRPYQLASHMLGVQIGTDRLFYHMFYQVEPRVFSRSDLHQAWYLSTFIQKVLALQDQSLRDKHVQFCRSRRFQA